MFMCVHEYDSDRIEIETEFDLDHFAECLVSSIHWIGPTQMSESFISLALEFTEFKQLTKNTEHNSMITEIIDRIYSGRDGIGMISAFPSGTVPHTNTYTENSNLTNFHKWKRVI